MMVSSVITVNWKISISFPDKEGTNLSINRINRSMNLGIKYHNIRYVFKNWPAVYNEYESKL